MREKNRILSGREEKVMECLWGYGKPMTITELEAQMAGEGLGKASIFKAVQALTDYGYIDVSGVEKIKRSYARQLRPSITKEEYAAILLTAKGIDRSSLGEIAVAMTGAQQGSLKNKKENEKLIKELEGIIARLRS